MPRYITLAMLSVACGAAHIQIAQDYAGQRITTSESDGVRVLLSSSVGVRNSWLTRKEPFGRVLVAHDADEFDDLWDELRTRAPKPMVDFRRRIVVAEIRSDDGCVDEVVGFTINRQGVGRLSVAHLTSWCILPLVTVAHAVSLPRSRLPTSGFYFQAKDAKKPVAIAVGSPGTELVRGRHDGVIKSRGTVLGQVSLPARGDIEIGQLASGERVFVVHHADGSFSVLPSATNHPDRRISGLKQAIVWNARLRRFMAFDGGYLDRAWDERGTSIFGAATAHLPAFSVQRRGDSLVVHPAGEQSPEQRLVVAHPPYQTGAAAKETVAYRVDEAIPLTDALKREGETVVIDTALVQYADLAPALCSRKTKNWRSECPSGSPRPVGLTLPAHKESMYYLSGPLAAQIHQGNASNLVYLGGGHGSSTLKRTWPSFRERWHMMFSTALTGAGNADGHAFLGGTFNVGLGKRVPASDDFTGSMRKYGVGDTFGFDLRLRAFPGTADGEAATLATFSIGPRLLSDLNPSWRIPSAVGLVLPEVGWMKNTAGDDGLFLGWSLMIQKRIFGTDIYGGPSLLITDLDDFFSSPFLTFELGIRVL